MTLQLHLGVIDHPYVDAPGKGKSKGSTKTTGDIAEILEEKYEVMEHFVDLHEKDIAADLESGVAGSIESLMMGAPPSHDPFGTATDAIKKRFTDFIENKEMDKLGIAGVPTQASLKGVDHRKKSGKGTPGRPSFRDTLQYLNAFKAWVE